MSDIQTDLVQVIESVWSSTLGLTVEARAEEAHSDDLEQAIAAWLEISGDSPSGLLLECSEAMARAAASTLFAVGPEDITPRDLHDAVGELINIIGGNVRTLLSGHSQLGLPRTTLTTPLETLSGEEGGVRNVLNMESGGMNLRLTVKEITA